MKSQLRIRFPFVVANAAHACNLRRKELSKTTIAMVAHVLIGARRQPTAGSWSKSASLRRTIDKKVGMS